MPAEEKEKIKKVYTVIASVYFPKTTGYVCSSCLLQLPRHLRVYQPAL